MGILSERQTASLGREASVKHEKENMEVHSDLKSVYSSFTINCIYNVKS